MWFQMLWFQLDKNHFVWFGKLLFFVFVFLTENNLIYEFALWSGGVNKEVKLAVAYIFDVDVPDELRDLPLGEEDAVLG